MITTPDQSESLKTAETAAGQRSDPDVPTASELHTAPQPGTSALRTPEHLTTECRSAVKAAF